MTAEQPIPEPISNSDQCPEENNPSAYNWSPPKDIDYSESSLAKSDLQQQSAPLSHISAEKLKKENSQD